MDTVGIYVDGMNIDLGLSDAGESRIQLNIGSILNEYAGQFGSIIDRIVHIDETYDWRVEGTESDLVDNGFDVIRDERFPHKSLTDFRIGCQIIDRLHAKDCPDMFILVTGDKDFLVVLEYIDEHDRRAMIIGESNSLAAPLLQKCQELEFDCHSIQLISESIRSSGVMTQLPTTQR